MDRIITGVLVAMLVAGLGLLAYPTVSDWWNQRHASRAISTYDNAVEELTKEKLASIKQAADNYNAGLVGKALSFKMSKEERAAYDQLLSVDDSNIMGSVKIERLGVDLPIYHGTSDGVLQVGIGHLEGTSLPLSGPSTHSVLVGHRGLPSAELFSKLDTMVEGDTFCLTVLGEKLWYEVDQVLIVEPDDLSALSVEEGRDYCTLLTCTPYGINTHRLLVRGTRVDGPREAVHVTADAVRVEPVLVASVIAAPVLVVMAIVALVRPGRKKRDGE